MRKWLRFWYCTFFLKIPVFFQNAKRSRMQWKERRVSFDVWSMKTTCALRLISWDVCMLILVKESMITVWTCREYILSLEIFFTHLVVQLQRNFISTLILVCLSHSPAALSSGNSSRKQTPSSYFSITSRLQCRDNSSRQTLLDESNFSLSSCFSYAFGLISSSSSKSSWSID